MSTKIYSVLLSAISIAAISCNNNQTANNMPSAANVFSKLDYDKVIAYDYNGEGDIEIIDEKTKHLASKIRKQKILNKTQILKITNDLCDGSSYGGDVAACFDPHLGIVFFKKDIPIAYVSICLDCNYLVSSIKIPKSDNGFSDKGVKRIIDFEKEIGVK